jgi:hypothetical protein
MFPLLTLPNIPALTSYFGIGFRFYSMDRKQLLRSSDVLQTVWNQARRIDEKVSACRPSFTQPSYARMIAEF